MGISSSIKKHRFKTEETFIKVSHKNKKQRDKAYYKNELGKLLSRLDENNEVDEGILGSQKECRRILRAEKELGEKYKRFEGYGNPPEKIIHLLEEVNRFERKVDGALDEELKREVREMTSKKYDSILKYEEQKRKMVIQKYNEQARRERMEEKSLGEDAYKEDTKRFKINSKGREVFTYNKK